MYWLTDWPKIKASPPVFFSPSPYTGIFLYARALSIQKRLVWFSGLVQSVQRAASKKQKTPHNKNPFSNHLVWTKFPNSHSPLPSQKNGQTGQNGNGENGPSKKSREIIEIHGIVGEQAQAVGTKERVLAKKKGPNKIVLFLIFDILPFTSSHCACARPLYISFYISCLLLVVVVLLSN